MFPVKSGTAASTSAKPRGAAQAKVALKSAFPTVAKSALKGALDAQNLAVFAPLTGKNAMSVGVVTMVYAPKGNSIVLLNFAPNYKSALVGAVSAKHFRLFPDLQKLKGQRVALSGKVVRFKGQPEIELTNAGAIRIVK